MTFDELKNTLLNLRKQRRHLDVLAERVKQCEADAASLSSPLGRENTPVKSSSSESVTERAAIRLYNAHILYEKALSDYMELEQELSSLLPLLTEEEQDIIMDSYVFGTPAWKMAEKYFCSERDIYRKRQKILKNASFCN